MVKQMAENTTAAKADWLIGEGCLLPGVKGVALRNMKAPGTAYNDEIFVSCLLSLSNSGPAPTSLPYL
jgi:Zn-dependent metalloprotease